MKSKKTPLTPILDVQEFKDAYERLSEGKRLEDHRILSFAMVREQLVQGAYDLEGAAIEVLLDFMEHELSQLRHLYDLPLPDPKWTPERVLQDVKVVAQLDNDWLTCCTLIHYVHIRADLNFDFKDLYPALPMAERTIRRKLAPYWLRLRRAFVREEIKVRRNYWQSVAHLSLPALPPQWVNAYQPLIAKIIQQVQNGEVTQILVKGEPGIGKSALAARLGHELIDMGYIHQTVYLNLRHFDPAHTSLLQLMTEKLDLPVGTPSELEQHIRAHQHQLARNHHRLLVLVDHLESWEQDFAGAYHWLGHFIVIATTQRSLEWHGISIECPPLPHDVAIQLLRRWDNDDTDPAVYEYMVNTVGGNPGVLQQVLNAFQALPPHASFSQTALRDYYLQQWRGFDKLICQIWVLVEMTTNRQWTPYATLRRVVVEQFHFSEDLFHTGLLELVKAKFITFERTQDLYFCDEIICLVIGQDSAFQTILHDLSGKYQWGELIIAFLERIQTVESIGWLEEGRRQASTTGEWQSWLECLHRLQAKSLHITWAIDLEKTIARRWSGQFEAALAHSHTISYQLEESPFQHLYAALLIEQSNLYFYLNKISEALLVARKGHQILTRLEDEELLDKCNLAMAQALSIEEPETARQWLTAIEVQDAATWDLIARLEMRLKNKPKALQAAQNTVQLSLNHPSYARALGLLARTLDFNDQYALAIEKFAHAIDLLQLRRDWFGLARMFTNDAIAHLHYAEQAREPKLLDTAAQYLEQAFQLYATLQDNQGHATAQSALQYLHDLRGRLH